MEPVSAAQQLAGLDVAYDTVGTLPNAPTAATTTLAGLDFVAGTGSRDDDLDLRFEARGQPAIARQADDAHMAAAMRVAADFSHRQRAAAAARSFLEADRAHAAWVALTTLEAPAPMAGSLVRPPQDESMAFETASGARLDSITPSSRTFDPAGVPEASAWERRTSLDERMRSAVPEPASMLLLLAGVACLGGRAALRFGQGKRRA